MNTAVKERESDVGDSWRPESGRSPGDFEKMNPFRRPQWRWDRVQYLLRNSKKPSRKKDDEETHRLFKCLSSKEKAQGKGRHSFAVDVMAIAEAFQLFELPDSLGNRKEIVEIYLLAGESDEKIAARTGLNSECIRWYEIAFFNVLAALESRIYIITRILIDGSNSGGYRVGRYLGYFGGPVVASLYFATVLNMPFPDEISKHFREPKYEDARLRFVVQESIDVIQAREDIDFLKIAEAHNKAAAEERRHPRVAPLLKEYSAEDMAQLKAMVSMNWNRKRHSILLEHLCGSVGIPVPETEFDFDKFLVSRSPTNSVGISVPTGGEQVKSVPGGKPLPRAVTVKPEEQRMVSV